MDFATHGLLAGARYQAWLNRAARQATRLSGRKLTALLPYWTTGSPGRLA